MEEDYREITQEEFDKTLVDCLRKNTGEQLLFIPGIYEIVAEYFNDEVMDTFIKENFK